MNRMALVAIAVAAAVALGLAYYRQMPVAAVQVVQEDVPATTRRADVRVEHEIVRVPLPAAKPLLRPRAVTQVTRRATQPAGAMAKARRWFVGDGRHKPQPFPMVRP